VSGQLLKHAVWTQTGVTALSFSSTAKVRPCLFVGALQTAQSSDSINHARRSSNSIGAAEIPNHGSQPMGNLRSVLKLHARSQVSRESEIGCSLMPRFYAEP
jgi:hypothetical protein